MICVILFRKISLKGVVGGGGGGGLGDRGTTVQWNLDLTKSLGTDQICSLNRGFVKSKTSI